MRNATIDFAKLFAAAGIVIFHSNAPGAAIGYAALPFFIMLLICLAWPAAERQAAGKYTIGRVRRLMIPWVVWSGVYGSMKLVEVLATGKPFAEEFASWMWLTGPSIHLWFLPFALASCLMLWPLARLSEHWSERSRLGFAAGFTLFAVVTLMATYDLGLSAPMVQWAFGLPAVMLGIAFSLGQKSVRPKTTTALLIAATLAGAAFTGWMPGAEQLTLAAVFLWLCLALPMPESRMALLLGDLALPLYLAHPMVASIIKRVTSFEDETVLAIATLTSTLALAILLRLALEKLRKQTRRPSVAA